MERLKPAEESEKITKPSISKAGYQPMKEKSVGEIVSRLPGRLVEQSETKGSRITYIVKFVEEDYDEQPENKFEILNSNTGRPEVDSPSNTVRKGRRPKTTPPKHDVDTSILRSKELLKHLKGF